jgi:hypothetical protein
MTPEQRARQTIDTLLAQAGWVVQDRRQLNLGAARGVAICEFSTLAGPADYLLVVDGQAVGVIEAKKAGETLLNYDMFLGYLALGTNRGYGTLSAQLHKDVRWLERLGTRFGWKRRAEIFTAIIQRKELRRLIRDALLSQSPMDGWETKQGR